MFEGYNLDLSKIEAQAFLNVSDADIEAYEEKINGLKKSLKNKIDTEIKLPRTSDNRIDGSKLINDWFPEYRADVFISHSHNNARTAKRLAVWLTKNFGLTVFIDSIVWGSANELLRGIDDEYSVLNKKNGKTTYNYGIRNYTTSHVHMMLSTALNDIINQTECLFFLNTPESLSVNESTNKKTNSPWIYSELKTASIVRRVHPRKKALEILLEKRHNVYSAHTKESIDILYTLEAQLSMLKSLDANQLQRWLEKYNRLTENINALDLLYFGATPFVGDRG